jgi:hypothetical protein
MKISILRQTDKAILQDIVMTPLHVQVNLLGVNLFLLRLDISPSWAFLAGLLGIVLIVEQT